MLGVLALGVPLSGWGALYPQNTWLQVGPVALGMPVAIWALRRWPLSNLSAACLALFIALHLVAARWSYSFVPYNRWLVDGFGFDLDHAMGFTRNMFDRLVHLLFGVLMMRPIGEILMRYCRMTRVGAVCVALLFVAGVSAFYEIFEWMLTITLSPADSGAYNGEQGDMYDSQKDMACAVFGALLVLPIAALRSRKAAG